MDAFFGRIDGLVDRERLRESRVVVIGQGAIGSSVTHLLNQCGVGNIFGFDGDDVEPGNPVRGHLPFTHMGLPKAQSLDVSLTQHLPSSKYVAVPFATSTMEGQRELAEVLKQGVDLIIIAVGNHNTSRMIDAIVAPFKVPRIHTWTTRGAAAGVVFGIQPGKDLPDYYLYDKLVRAGQVPYLPEVPESEIPNVSERGCSAPVLPGTPLDIGSVALHAARTAINLLHGEEVPTYQVWTQADQNWEDMPLTVPNMLGLEVMEPLPKVKQVVLAYAMRLAIEEEIRASPKRETGGVFMGQVVKEELRLEYASGPGLQAKRTRNRLVLDVRYAQGCINAVRRLTNNRLRYFGE